MGLICDVDSYSADLNGNAVDAGTSHGRHELSITMDESNDVNSFLLK